MKEDATPNNTLLKVIYESGSQEPYHKLALCHFNSRKIKEERLRKGIHPLKGERKKKGGMGQMLGKQKES